MRYQFIAVLLLAQGPQPPSTIAAPPIAGVIAPGTTIELVNYPVEGTEGPVGLPDGSLLFTETRADRITRVDLQGITSTYVEKSNGSNGLGFDAKGRLIAGAAGAGQRTRRRAASARQRCDAGRSLRRQVLPPAQRPGRQRPRRRVFHRHAGRVLPAARGHADARRAGHSQSEWRDAQPGREDALRQHKDGEYLLAFDVQPDGTLTTAVTSASTEPHRERTQGPAARRGQRRRRPRHRQRGSRLRGHQPWRGDLQPQGQHLGVIPIGIWGGEQFMLSKPQNLTFAGRTGGRCTPSVRTRSTRSGRSRRASADARNDAAARQQRHVECRRRPCDCRVRKDPAYGSRL